MSPLALATICVGLLGLLLISEPLARLTHLPRPTIQLILGAAAATLVVAAGYDTGLRFQNFHDLVFYGFLPVLIFEAAYSIDFPSLKKLLLPVLSLAVLGVIATCLVVALGLYVGIGHPGFPWLAALLTGVLLAATDPAAVTSQLASGTRVALLLEGESLFNDATAIVLFSLILTIGITAMEPATGAASSVFLTGAWTFGKTFFGGALVGLAAGFFANLAVRGLHDESARHWLGLFIAFGAYLAAHAVDVSGAMACLIAGLMFGRRSTHPTPVWRMLADTATGVLFLLMGATLQANMFQQRWLAILIAIGAVFLARALVVQLTLLITNSLTAKTSGGRLTGLERAITGSLGMRGAITLALVLTLPTDLPYWWTIQSIAYGVVFFDMCVIAPLAPLLTARLPEQSTSIDTDRHQSTPKSTKGAR